MKRGFVALMAVVCLVLAGITLFLRFTEDREAPEIHFQDNEITYTQGEDYEGLLLGVTATDNKDGDVTDSLVVESVYPNDDGENATVVYVAKDSSNNIGKASKSVDYRLSSEGETGAEEEPVADETADAAAAQSGAESGTEDTPEGQDGTPEENNDGEGQDEDLEAENLSPGSPVIKLSKSRVTISRGESINRISYVESITDDKDDENTLWRRIEIKGDEFDANTPGTYEQIYYVVDSDGNKSNEAKLTIVVQ